MDLVMVDVKGVGVRGRYRMEGAAVLWVWDAILVLVALHFYCSKCCSSFFFFSWLTHSISTFSMGCVFLEEATDQPPPGRMLGLHLEA